jgi:hypothetical protein
MLRSIAYEAIDHIGGGGGGNLVAKPCGIRTQRGQTKVNDGLIALKLSPDLGKVRAVPRICELYPGICLTTEEKARKNPSQGSRKSTNWHGPTCPHGHLAGNQDKLPIPISLY